VTHFDSELFIFHDSGRHFEDFCGGCDVIRFCMDIVSVPLAGLYLGSESEISDAILFCGFGRHLIFGIVLGCVRNNEGTGRKVSIMGSRGGCFSSDSQGYTKESNHGSSSHYQNFAANVYDLQPYSDLINGTSHR
jgi:hypothetical protein